VRTPVATSVARAFRAAAELWPRNRCGLLSLTAEQQEMLKLFGSETILG
jgi:hypothetical protein